MEWSGLSSQFGAAWLRSNSFYTHRQCCSHLHPHGMRNRLPPVTQRLAFFGSQGNGLALAAGPDGLDDAVGERDSPLAQGSGGVGGECFGGLGGGGVHGWFLMSGK